MLAPPWDRQSRHRCPLHFGRFGRPRCGWCPQDQHTVERSSIACSPPRSRRAAGTLGGHAAVGQCGGRVRRRGGVSTGTGSFGCHW
jgi:hypothetical protein